MSEMIFRPYKPCDAAAIASWVKDIETIHDVEINGEKWTIQEMEVLK